MKEWYAELECVECGERHFYINKIHDVASVQGHYEKEKPCEECGGKRELVMGNTMDNPLPRG